MVHNGTHYQKDGETCGIPLISPESSLLSMKTWAVIFSYLRGNPREIHQYLVCGTGPMEQVAFLKCIRRVPKTTPPPSYQILIEKFSFQ